MRSRTARAWPRATPSGAASLFFYARALAVPPPRRRRDAVRLTQVREAPEDVRRLAAMLDDADEDAKRRKRETAYGLLRHASRAGKVAIVAPLVDAAIDGCADAKQ